MRACLCFSRTFSGRPHTSILPKDKCEFCSAASLPRRSAPDLAAETHIAAIGAALVAAVAAAATARAAAVTAAVRC